jgi:hypothetical protein
MTHALSAERGAGGDAAAAIDSAETPPLSVAAYRHAIAWQISGCKASGYRVNSCKVVAAKVVAAKVVAAKVVAAKVVAAKAVAAKLGAAS